MVRTLKIISILVLITASSFSQISGFAFWGSSPYDTDSLTYYWHYADAPNPVNVWTNRIDTSTLIQGTGSAQPSISSGVIFDGSDDGIYKSSMAYTSYRVTVELVVYNNDTNAANNQMIVGLRNSTNHINMALGILTNATTTYKKLYFWGYEGTGYGFAYLTANCHLASWTHYVITKEAGVLKLYVNGVQVNEEAGNLGALIFNQANYISVGARDNANAVYWNGKIRLLRIYYAVKNQASVTLNYQNCISQGLLN